MRIVLLASFLFIYSISFGQKTISGQVIDKETKLPLKGANIVVFGSTNGTITNDSGYFEFEPKYKNLMARISYVGYSYYDIKLVPKKSIIAELTGEVTMITPMNIGLGEYSGPSQYFEPEVPKREFMMEEESADQAYIIVEESANFYKGLDNLYAFFAANFRYPKKVLDENLSGKVFIEFTVLSDGSVGKVKFLKDDVLDVVKIELERLFAEMPNWTPATQRGENVKQTFALAIQYAANR